MMFPYRNYVRTLTNKFGKSMRKIVVGDGFRRYFRTMNALISYKNPKELQIIRMRSINVMNCRRWNFSTARLTFEKQISPIPLVESISKDVTNYNDHDNVKVAVKYWLLGTAALCLCVIFVGGLTRLEDAGLSMVHWSPLSFIPPMSPSQWEVEFAEYRKFPEFQKQNSNISLQEFKRIYWYEFLHRILGRIIGLTFVLPGIYFGLRGYLHGYRRRLLAIGTLIGCQGVMGWYMVKSGLDSNHELAKKYNTVRVSQYRLAAHLGLAITIYAGLIWTFLDYSFMLTNLRRKKVGLTASSSVTSLSSVTTLGIPRSIGISLNIILISLLFTIISGAFVAGLDAGKIYNTYPKMNGEWIPQGEILRQVPFWRNIFENPTTVQFDHRALSAISFLNVLYLTGKTFQSFKKFPSSFIGKVGFLAVLTMFQMALGITTLLNGAPTNLAVTHQSGAMALFTASLWTLWSFKKL